jgi:hypothetical protein
MTHLRRKLEGGGRRVFRTEAGVGYGLLCPEGSAGEPEAGAGERSSSGAGPS